MNSYPYSVEECLRYINLIPAVFCSAATQKRERDRTAHLNYYGNKGDNYRTTRLKLNQHASLSKYTANINILQTKPWFGRLTPGNGVGLYSGW